MDMDQQRHDDDDDDDDVLLIDDPIHPPGINFVSNKRFVHVRWTGDDKVLRLKLDMSRSGVGGILWSLALALPRYIERREGLCFSGGLDGKSVLVLGAGLGFEGLVLGLKENKAHSVYLTDLPAVLSTMQCNIDLNRALLLPDQRVQARALEWGPAGWKKWQSAGMPEAFDYVIGCEIVYCEEALDDLKYTIQQLVRPILDERDDASPQGHTVLYLAFESRYFSCLQFVRELALLPATSEDGEEMKASQTSNGSVPRRFYHVESVTDFEPCGAEDAFIFRISPNTAHRS